MKKSKKGMLPEVDEKGFFQIFHDVKIGKKEYAAGSWMKLLSASKSGLTWTVRPKYHKDSTAVSVRSAVFAHE